MPFYFFASSCGGAPISIVRQSIEQQQTPHRSSKGCLRRPRAPIRP
ncbi:hypothetical protein E6P07_10200 [Thermochromatium tepidum ATCC 43061]|uniref:Uncharacterized protein n=1 Tax=Thermochromatium tepidum ATCC 43061 TaxID=316276 RepID=A0A6I6E9R4_THETI|nr:hypothetical protein E6P07_10200 [Thermochromatium tepidum ATCC 43061]